MNFLTTFPNTHPYIIPRLQLPLACMKYATTLPGWVETTLSIGTAPSGLSVGLPSQESRPKVMEHELSWWNSFFFLNRQLVGGSQILTYMYAMETVEWLHGDDYWSVCLNSKHWHHSLPLSLHTKPVRVNYLSLALHFHYTFRCTLHSCFKWHQDGQRLMRKETKRILEEVKKGSLCMSFRLCSKHWWYKL